MHTQIVHYNAIAKYTITNYARLHNQHQHSSCLYNYIRRVRDENEGSERIRTKYQWIDNSVNCTTTQPTNERERTKEG
jgi:hypothetical protein